MTQQLKIRLSHAGTKQSQELLHQVPPRPDPRGGEAANFILSILNIRQSQAPPETGQLTLARGT